MFAECKVVLSMHSKRSRWLLKTLTGWEIQSTFKPLQTKNLNNTRDWLPTAQWSCEVVRVGAFKWFLMLEGKLQTGFHLKWTQALRMTWQVQNTFFPSSISNSPDVCLFNCLCNNKILTGGFDLISTKSIVVLICLKAEWFLQVAATTTEKAKKWHSGTAGNSIFSDPFLPFFFSHMLTSGTLSVSQK